MTRDELVALMRSHRHGVQASLTPGGAPQAALVGYVVSDSLEVFFDTLATTRKAKNLAADPRASFVIGADGDAFTVQVEGVVDAPAGDDLARLQALYFAAFPDGPTRLAWPGITYLRLRPTWVRVSDYRDGETITELDHAALRVLGG
jgi:general stress protein 26